MSLKKGGILERAMQAEPADGICKTCGNLIKISETEIGCAAHDKFILPEYPPHHEYNAKCQDWQKGEAQ